MKKTLIGGLAAATLVLAAPAWAHGGPPHGHAYGHWKHGHHHVHRHVVRERYVVREVVRPVPVVPRAVYPVYPAAAPGIHVVLPSLFVPFY